MIMRTRNFRRCCVLRPRHALAPAVAFTLALLFGVSTAGAADPFAIHGKQRQVGLKDLLTIDSDWKMRWGWQREMDRVGLLSFQVAQAAQKVQAKAASGSQSPASEGDAFTDVNAAARKSSNPLGGDFFILLNQIDNYFLEGDASDHTQHINTWAFQPVIPVPMTNVLGENWIWVNRPTFPFIMNADVPDIAGIRSGLDPGGGQPEIPPGFPPGNIPFKGLSGMGDLIYFTLLGQSLPQKIWGGGDFVWGVGPSFTFPTATNDQLGSGRFSVGPSGVLAFIGKKFIIGGLYQSWLSFGRGGKGSGNNVNFSWLNLFYFWNLEDGWQIGGTPVITADWEANKDNRWTLPIALGVYKTSIFFGKMPMKMGVEFQYMPVRPDVLGQQFNIRLVLAPIVPSLFK